MEVLLKIKNATPGNIKIKLNKALKRLGTDFHIEKCIKIRKSEKGRKLQGRINFQGLNISIENRKGSIRYGIDSDGHSWKTKMNYPYGRIIGVQRLGHDGDHIDCYVGDNRQSDKVYIIHIKNCVTGKYDEDKIMLGFNNQKEVITAFKTQYDNFSKIFDGIEKMSIYEFKECLKKKTKSIIVKLKDFTHENADYKVIKALAGVGKALNCDFICKSINHAEKPSYQALQDIIDNSNAEVEKIKRQAYNFICKFLGLPKINKITKSISDELTVNGKIIFDPLYGTPLKQKDFAQMINKLENFLSRRLAETERQMLLQSTALGHLIALSKNGQTQLLLETVKLKNIVHKGKSFEQLCTDYETLKHNFDKVTDNEIAKLQFIEDKIGVYVTSAKDATIKIIKDIYYDAVINHKSKQQISQEMYDQLGFLNRSWDTIARTESNNLKNHAFIVGSLNDEGKTYFRRRVGSYNTCKICASHRNKIALWSEKPLTDDTINDELADIAIWSGKSNIGRTQKDWWIPEGSTHPNCFCEWEKLLDEEIKYFRKSFIESDHPRGNGGRFIKKFAPDKGGVCGGSYEEKKEKKSQKAEKYNECKNDFLKVSLDNAKNIGKKILSNWKKENPNGIKCKALKKNVKIKRISFSHLFEHRVKGIMEPRDPSEIARRVSCLPIAKEIIEDKGVLVETRHTDGFLYETLRARKNGKFIDVVVSTDKRNNTVYISVFPRDNIKKSVSTACDFRGDFQQAPLQAPKKSASPACHLGSSFKAGSPYDKYGNYYADDTVEDNIAEVIEMSSYWRKLNRH